MRFNQSNRGSGRIIPDAQCIPAESARHQQDWGFWDGICHTDLDPLADEGEGGGEGDDLGDAGKKALEAERARAKEADPGREDSALAITAPTITQITRLNGRLAIVLDSGFCKPLDSSRRWSDGWN